MTYTKITKTVLSLSLVSSLFLSFSASAVNIMTLPGQNNTPKTTLNRTGGETDTSNYSDGIRTMYLPNQNSQNSFQNKPTSNYQTSDNIGGNGTLTRTNTISNTSNNSKGNFIFEFNGRDLRSNSNISNSSDNVRTIAFSQNNSTNNSTNFCNQDFANRMLGQINDFRRQNGVPAVSMDTSLSNVACDHSGWMRSNNDLSHYGINGTDPFQRCANAGTSCNAENVAYHTAQNLDWIMNYFKTSPTHRTNMLNRDYKKVGIGLNGIYVTQLFAL